MANNRCPNCHCGFRSRTHAIKCGHKTRQEWNHTHHRAGTSSYAPRRANASAVLGRSSMAEITPVHGIGNMEPVEVEALIAQEIHHGGLQS